MATPRILFFQLAANGVALSFLAFGCGSPEPGEEAPGWSKKLPVN